MKVSEEFLKEEVRCDYTVTTEFKKLWAVQMDILERFAQVCEKHGLRYFAAGGTLLGAIRHKGYIPWDDDIDVQMLEEDYYKLCEIAPEEFQEPFFFQSWQTEKDARPYFSRLRRSDTKACTREEMEIDPDRNKGVFIDIFAMSGVPDNRLAYGFKMFRLKFLRQIINGNKFDRLMKRASGKQKLKYRLDPRRITWSVLKHFVSFRKLSDHYVKVSRGKPKNTLVAASAFRPGDKKLTWKREDYAECIDLPFEYTTIKGPGNYDSVLRQQYGDYMTPKKGGAYHSDLIFNTDGVFEK